MNLNNIFNNCPETEMENRVCSLIELGESDQLKIFLLDNEELFLHFLDNSPSRFISLIRSMLSTDSLRIYNKSVNEFVIKLVYDFIKERNPVAYGTLSMKDLIIKLEDNGLENSLNESTQVVDEEFVELLELSDSLNLDNIPVEMHLNDKVIIKQKKNSSILSNGLIAASLFISFSAFSMDSTPDIKTETINALGEVQDVRDFIDSQKKIVEWKTKKIVDQIDNKEVAIVVGVASKIAIEQKISHKGKFNTKNIGLSELSLGNLNYQVEVNAKGELKGEISGKNPFMANSEYEINAVTSKKETKVKIEMNFAFN